MNSGFEIKILLSYVHICCTAEKTKLYSEENLIDSREIFQVIQNYKEQKAEMLKYTCSRFV